MLCHPRKMADRNWKGHMLFLKWKDVRTWIIPYMIIGTLVLHNGVFKLEVCLRSVGHQRFWNRVTQFNPHSRIGRGIVFFECSHWCGIQSQYWSCVNPSEASLRLILICRRFSWVNGFQIWNEVVCCSIVHLGSGEISFRACTKFSVFQIPVVMLTKEFINFTTTSHKWLLFYQAV